MDMSCENCGKTVTALGGEFIYYQNRLFFACKACADKLNDEIRCSRTASAAIEGKRTQAESILCNKAAYGKFLNSIEGTMKKIHNVGTMRSDIRLLGSLVNSYINGDYHEVDYKLIVAAVATLLYVIHPIDIIPDVIPGVGFSDDAMALAFFIQNYRDEITKYKAWRKQRNAVV